MNGCFDRDPLADYYPVQVGWNSDGTRRMVTIQNQLTKECQYSKDDFYTDPACNGCIHRRADA